MKILALEFSSVQRSVAVVERVLVGPERNLPQESNARAGDRPMISVSLPAVAPRTQWVQHEAVESGPDSNKPFELIEQVLRQAGFEREQIDCLAIGLGPGSYTGIRAAIALAQGWQLATTVHLIGLSSAECVAAQAHSDGLLGRTAVVIDAQRGEFYLSNYELSRTGWKESQPLRLVSQATVVDCENSGDLLVGPEIARWFPRGRTIFPRAATLGTIASTRTGFTPGEKLEPIYLRQTTFVKAPPPRILPD